MEDRQEEVRRFVDAPVYTFKKTVSITKRLCDIESSDFQVHVEFDQPEIIEEYQHAKRAFRCASGLKKTLCQTKVSDALDKVLSQWKKREEHRFCIWRLDDHPCIVTKEVFLGKQLLVKEQDGTIKKYQNKAGYVEAIAYLLVDKPVRIIGEKAMEKGFLSDSDQENFLRSVNSEKTRQEEQPLSLWQRICGWFSSARRVRRRKLFCEDKKGMLRQKVTEKRSELRERIAMQHEDECSHRFRNPRGEE